MKELLKYNSEGQPLALPWIEQEGHVWESNGILEKEHGILIKRSHFNALRLMRLVYRLKFDPAIHLVGDKAVFEGFMGSGGYIKYGEYEILTYTDGTRNFRVEGGKYKPLNAHRPQTLSHFISDCHRAGIPLTWTPYGLELLGIELEGGEE